MNNLPFTRHIILMRHAQSAGKQAGQTDRARILTPDGEDRARKTGLMLHRFSAPPDYLISSSAMRSKMTAHCVNETLNLTASRLRFLDHLYEATTDEWEHELTVVPRDSRCVLCVGHNPVLSVLASDFARRTIELVPGGIAMFSSKGIAWQRFRIGLTELSHSTIN